MASSSCAGSKKPNNKKKNTPGVYGFALLENEDTLLADLIKDLEREGYAINNARIVPPANGEILEISKSSVCNWIGKVKTRIDNSNRIYIRTYNIIELYLTITLPLQCCRWN